jgi:hypothetical protein
METTQLIRFINQEIVQLESGQSKYFCFQQTPVKILELISAKFDAGSYLVEQQLPASDLDPRLIYMAKIFSEVYRSEIFGDFSRCPYCCRKLVNETIEKTNIGICWNCHIYTEIGHNNIDNIDDKEVEKWAKIWICILEKRLQYLEPEFLVSQNKQQIKKIIAEWEDVPSIGQLCDF